MIQQVGGKGMLEILKKLKKREVIHKIGKESSHSIKYK
jgi:hypothetical protein